MLTQRAPASSITSRAGRALGDAAHWLCIDSRRESEHPLRIMSLVGVANETLAIIERGSYTAPSGKRVDVRAAVDAAVRGTVLYRPAALDALAVPPRPAGAPSPRIEITPETTAEAGRRLVEAEGVERVAALNFASAKNAGGGFLRGAKAQEEDLSRCSALYSCLVTQRDYYDENRAHGSMLYTDHLIYSPDVPFFRDDRLDLLEAPFLLSILTAPAPNAGEASSHGRNEGHRVKQTLDERAGKVLAVAAAHGHSCLVLGAWGCGVFRNDPRDVADVFARWLAHERFRGAFDRVVFAVYDRGGGGPNLRAFEDRFGRRA
jgi:uncharacterized protein (TIGR02452 family)